MKAAWRSGQPWRRCAVDGEPLLFAGGCFWGVQAVFQHTQGRDERVSGYSGGEGNGELRQIGSGDHRPCGGVQVTFDPGSFVWEVAADLLLGGARPDAAESPGPDSARIPLGDLLRRPRRSRSPSATRAARCRPGLPREDRTQVAPLRASIPRRPITRTTRRCTRSPPTSSRSTCRRSPTSRRCFRSGTEVEPQLVGGKS